MSPLEWLGIILFLHILPSFFTNADDSALNSKDNPKFGDWYVYYSKAAFDQKFWVNFISYETYMNIRWWLRNPLHDLTHYVLGLTGRKMFTINIIPDSFVTLQPGRLTLCIRSSGIIPIPTIGWYSKHWKMYFGMVNRGALIILPRISYSKEEYY